MAAAESAGSLVAAEIEYYGIPFDTAAHDAHLTEILGPRPPEGEHPAKLMELAEQIRADLFRAPPEPGFPAGTFTRTSRRRGERAQYPLLCAQGLG